MKRIFLALLIAILATSAVLDIKNYVLGNKFDQNKLYDSSGIYEGYQEAKDDMTSNFTDAVGTSGSINNRIYKLPNNHYYTLQMLTGNYKKSTYLYSGLIEIKNANETELTFPKNKLELIVVNHEFKDKSWQVKSKVGTFDFVAGDFGNSNPDDRKMSDDDGKRGLRISLTPKKGVTRINNNGIWLDHANFKVGMQNQMKVYKSEQKAIKSVKKDDFGKLLGVIQTKDMNFHIFRNQVDVFKEITVIPVSLKDNQIKAGKFERFTFEKGDGIKEVIEERIDDVDYILNFQQNSENIKKMKDQLKDGNMHIAVEVRGEKNAK
ncbi:hypothetical protein ACMGE9_08445 [Macrococcus sp. EM39E]|uniref:hypothetical protein n=1 Tax=Macrococcus animalis TaxID=3395467 RepID=UPI0039BE0126